MSYINPAFRDRNVPQITGSVVEPIEAQARDVTPRRDNRAHYMLCAILAVPIAFAVMAYVLGDTRLLVALFLVELAIALVGSYMLRGPA